MEHLSAAVHTCHTSKEVVKGTQIAVHQRMDAFEALALKGEATFRTQREQPALQNAQEQESGKQVTEKFFIVNYSEKALALFGDTKPIKDQLMVIGGRFNPKLTHEGTKRAGWIFSKSKEQELRNLLITKYIK